MPSNQNIVVYALVLAAPWCIVWLWRRDVFRPGSLTRLEATGRLRNPTPVAAAAWLGAAVATFLATAVGAGLAGMLLGVRRELGADGKAAAVEPGSAALMDVAAYALAAVVGMLCAALLTRGGRTAGTSPRELGIEARVSDAWKGLGGLIVVLPLCIAVGTVVALVAKLMQAEPERVAHSALRDIVAHRHAWHSWVKSLMAVLGASVMEELVYRVFLQSAIITALARLRNGQVGTQSIARASDVFWGIALSSVAFVLPHAGILGGPANWNALPSLAILGVGLGVLYERTRSPLAPIVMHAGFNAINIAAALLTSAAAGPAAG